MERPGREGTDADARALTRPDAAPLRAVELLIVAGLWTFYGALNVATGALEPHGGRPPLGGRSDINPRLFINPIVWALLTGLLLWLSPRVSLDRAFWRRRWALVLIVGVLVANLSDLASDTLWDALAPPAAVARAHTGGQSSRFRPGLHNLNWLDDLAVFLVVVGVASARGYLLRERARRDLARLREAGLAAESAQARADAAQLEAQLAEAKLDALRRQLDPHFLFNTLNAVSALADRDPAAVRRMIGQLGDLLRQSMDGASAAEVPLREELDLLARYVDIMRVRFEERLEVDVRAASTTLAALVPNMILQPLVENAIKHGVDGNEDRVRVEVEAILVGDTLVLRVSDDGPGMPTWSLDASGGIPVSGEGGVGLKNSGARLAQIYGRAHRFTVGPRAGGGSVVEIRLPYHTTDEATRV